MQRISRFCISPSITLFKVVIQRLKTADVGADLPAADEEDGGPGSGADHDAKRQDPFSKSGKPAKMDENDQQADAEGKQPDDRVRLLQLTVRPEADAEELRHEVDDVDEKVAHEDVRQVHQVEGNFDDDAGDQLGSARFKGLGGGGGGGF